MALLVVCVGLISVLFSGCFASSDTTTVPPATQQSTRVCVWDYIYPAQHKCAMLQTGTDEATVNAAFSVGHATTKDTARQTGKSIIGVIRAGLAKKTYC